MLNREKSYASEVIRRSCFILTLVVCNFLSIKGQVTLRDNLPVTNERVFIRTIAPPDSSVANALPLIEGLQISRQATPGFKLLDYTVWKTIVKSVTPKEGIDQQGGADSLFTDLKYLLLMRDKGEEKLGSNKKWEVPIINATENVK